MSAYLAIRVLLLLALALTAWWLVRPVSSASSLALRRLCIGAVVAAAIVAILVPSLANTAARAIGVERGVNLIVYGLVIALIAQMVPAPRNAWLNWPGPSPSRTSFHPTIRGTRTPRRAAHTPIRAKWNAPLTALLHRQIRQITIWLRMMSNVNLRPIQHSAVNFGRFGFLRGALAVLLAGVLFVVSSAGFVYAKLSTQFANRVVSIDAYASDEQNKATPDSFEGRAVNILVVGTDSRNGASGELGAGDADDVPGLRTDSTMVIHVSADRSRVQIVSIPRDTLVDIPACKHRDGTTSEPTTDDMFNNAMVYGANGGDEPEDIGPGIACVRSTVEKLSGMSIDAFMVVDFAGFVNMIDALGGVWFNIPDRIDDDSAQLYIDAGCWKLSGVHALAYMRSRKGQGDGSDISRIGRQQQLISAMLRELQDKNYVTDPGALISFLQAAISSVNVSPNLGNASSDASLLINVLQNIDRSNIQFVTMPVDEPSWDPNRRIPSDPMARNVWNALKNDQALPVGTTYTDGNGAQLVVPDPTATTTPSTPTPTQAPTTDPSSQDSSTDNTEQSASVANNAANEESAKQTAATCPPKNQ